MPHSFDNVFLPLLSDDGGLKAYPDISPLKPLTPLCAPSVMMSAFLYKHIRNKPPHSRHHIASGSRSLARTPSVTAGFRHSNHPSSLSQKDPPSNLVEKTTTGDHPSALHNAASCLSGSPALTRYFSDHAREQQQRGRSARMIRRGAVIPIPAIRA